MGVPARLRPMSWVGVTGRAAGAVAWVTIVRTPGGTGPGAGGVGWVALAWCRGAPSCKKIC